MIATGSPPLLRNQDPIEQTTPKCGELARPRFMLKEKRLTPLQIQRQIKTTNELVGGSGCRRFDYPTCIGVEGNLNRPGVAMLLAQASWKPAERDLARCSAACSFLRC